MPAINALKSKATSLLASVLGRLGDVGVFGGLLLIAGLASSWYMVEAGTQLTTRAIGPWVTWPAAGRSDADPYTRAHFARRGTLNWSSAHARTYVALSDSDGGRLHSSCSYVVEGRDLDDAWWSVTAFDAGGRLIANPAQRYTFTRDTISLSPDGGYAITLSRDARPGNWLPTRGAGRISLVLNVMDQGRMVRAKSADAEPHALPEIRKESCR